MAGVQLPVVRRQRVRGAALLCALALLGAASHAFVGGHTAQGTVLQQRPNLRASSPVAREAGEALLALDAIEPAVAGYVAIWTPLFIAAKESGLAPDFLLHWGHGAAMGTVLLAMCGYGAFLGWQTRLGNGGEVYPLSLGQTARELHPTLMGLALFLFLLGGQGGLVLLATAGKPILQSAHSSTAVIGLALMGAQAALGLNMGNSETGRTAHAVFGSATLLVLLVHLYFGLNLGSSF